jgi:predicted Zn finger-like uncharacterized protein
MKIVCDACQAKYSIADEKIQGKAFKIRCKKCGHIIVVKTGGDAAAAAAPAAAEKAKHAAAAESAAAAVTPAVVAAAPAADQAVWHVVIDGEQVGPINETEVKDRLRQGKINSDTLVWKEGFADWMQLSTVPELAAILARITQHPAAKPAANEPEHGSSAMNAMKAATLAQTAQPSVESDPFAAQTVVSQTASADLFASAVPAPAAPLPVAAAPSSPFLFGGATQPAEPVITIKNGNSSGSTHLTGQRNENSVLFSLSNLEALAVPSHSAGIRPPSSSSTTEGSGLIDIRSMAAMTLNDGQGESRRSTDALPTFSTPQFSPVAPVLLPMSSSGPPKWVYPVLGLLGVGILVLGYGIYKVVTAPAPGQVVVVAPPPAPSEPAPAPVPAPAAAPAAHPAPAVAPVVEAANPSTAEAKPAPADEKPTEKSGRSSGKAEKGHRKGGESASAKASVGDSRKAEPVALTPTPASDSSKSAGKKAGGGKSLDDLLGEVGSKRSGGDEPKPAAQVKLITLTQSDIVNAMKGIQPKVQACANQFKVPGTAMANISVASGGRVSNAAVTGKFAGTPTGSCVEVAAKSAKFPPCQGMTFPWPFTLSPR